MKTYVLTVSLAFPKTHKKAGEQTFFKEKLINGLAQLQGEGCKIHTIRSNYDLWSKRIAEIQSGKAILSIRYWSGKPYNSKQVEIYQLDENSGIGVQPLIFIDSCIKLPTICGEDFPEPTWYKGIQLSDISQNDGLSIQDFKEWFKGYDLSQTMAIIHFTKFRY